MGEISYRPLIEAMTWSYSRLEIFDDCPYRWFLTYIHTPKLKKEDKFYAAYGLFRHDLRNTNEISELCHKQQQPVFITKNGYGDLVVMSMETYDELLSTNHIDKAKAGFSDPKSAIYNA